MLLNHNRGFTLIEVAMVLFILGLLLAGLLPPLATSFEEKRRATMRDQYDDIEGALIGFAIVNRRLPCPDCPEGVAAAACTTGSNNINDGIEDKDTGGCAVGSDPTIGGNLPWVTLGVKGKDPWGKILRYHVAKVYADELPEKACEPATASASFSICTAQKENITIKDAGILCDVATRNNVATNVPVVVVSEGHHNNKSKSKDTYDEDISCNEQGNIDGDDTFVERDYNLHPETYYDDMIFWISPFLLNSKMVDAEVLP